jgi:hypothetical protein
MYTNALIHSGASRNRIWLAVRIEVSVRCWVPRERRMKEADSQVEAMMITQQKGLRCRSARRRWVRARREKRVVKVMARGKEGE